MSSQPPFTPPIQPHLHMLNPHAWGFADLEIEHDLLTLNRLGLRRATAVFQDGTVVDPTITRTVAPLMIGGDVRNETVFLGLQAGQLELLLQSQKSIGCQAIPLAHILETRSDGTVVLDDAFIPAVLRIGAAKQLVTFVRELHELLHQRGEALSQRVSAIGRTAEIAEFLLLQVVNRYEPLFRVLMHSDHVHPEELYRVLVMVAGELATLTTAARRPPSFQDYAHHALRQTFDPVIRALRSSLSIILEQSAIPIPIEQKKYGVSVAVVADRTLYTNAVFVLAARADMPAEELRRRLPAQSKIGPVESISSLVNRQLAGVPLFALPVAPRQIPYHSGQVFFELDPTHEMWAQMRGSPGLALHVAGEFPGLALEFWAIRTG